MEEKELEQQTPSTETPKKGKGGKKKADSTKVNETVETVTDSPETHQPIDETPEAQNEVVVETPKDEQPFDEAPKAEKATVVEEKTSKAVPTIAELRKQRRFNESIFTFDDGFACVATSQRVADMKHNDWLKA